MPNPHVPSPLASKEEAVCPLAAIPPSHNTPSARLQLPGSLRAAHRSLWGQWTKYERSTLRPSHRAKPRGVRGGMSI